MIFGQDLDTALSIMGVKVRFVAVALGDVAGRCRCPWKLTAEVRR